MSLLLRLSGIFALATLVKVLLMAADMYHSTDFEVHRNWLAITHSLPPRQWYFEETSPWTLDYPPFFAWLEYCLSFFAARADPVMVQLSSQDYASRAAVLFQKGSVVALDATLPLGLLVFFWPQVQQARRGGSSDAGAGLYRATAASALVLLDAGLLLVDHIHFQYNGFLFGLLLLSVGFAQQGRDVAAAAAFAALLAFKHLFLSLAPLYFVYLLRHYCWKHPDRGGRGGVLGYPRVLRILTLGAVVAAVVALALGPLCLPPPAATAAGTRAAARKAAPAACYLQVRQLTSRLFPFGRGLTHAYWAPNFWALYLAADRVLLLAAKRMGLASLLFGAGDGGSRSLVAAIAGAVFTGGKAGSGGGGPGSFPRTTGGLVHAGGAAVLPSVRPAMAAIAVLAAGMPALAAVWRRPNQRVFLWATVYCSLCAFVFGWHVHEKAILAATIPLALLAPTGGGAARLYLRLCAAGYTALLPLFPDTRETPLKLLLLATHFCVAWALLQPVAAAPEAASVSPNPGRNVGKMAKDSEGGNEVFGLADVTYAAGLLVVVAVAEVIWPLSSRGDSGGPAAKLPFLPLMLTSTYCAVGVILCWLMALRELRREAACDAAGAASAADNGSRAKAE